MKKKLFLVTKPLIFIITALLVGYSGTSSATTHSVNGPEPKSYGPVKDKELSERVEKYGNIFSSWLAGNLDNSVVPAAAAGVIKGDKLIFNNGVNADKNTRFGLASLSKTFTALLVLKLEDENKLSLDDPIKKYLPGVVIERKELKSRPVTIQDLLSHTSGMPSSGISYKSYEVNGKLIQLPDQVYPAGYCYAYSNASYVLVMHIIEAATGRPYAENIKKNILDPLEMTSSSASHSNGTGGITTTINDLAKYASMLINEGTYKGKEIISRSSFQKMLAQSVELPRTGVDYHYSLSWEVMTVNQQVDSYYKAGRWNGQASGLQVFPKKKIAFIYLCNPPEHLGETFMTWRQSLTGRLRYLVRNITGDQTLCTSWTTLSPKELKWYEGDYLNRLTGEKVKVFLQNNRLFSNKFGIKQLMAFTSNRFLIGSGKMLHNFVWKNNKVVGLSLRSGYFQLVNQLYF